MHLVIYIQVGQFTVAESDDVLACEWDIRNKRVERIIQYPNRIDTHNLLLARLYARFFTYCQYAMEVCGLEQDEVRSECWLMFIQRRICFSIFNTRSVPQAEDLRFDSVHFHKLRAATGNGTESDRLQQLAADRNGFVQMRTLYAS